MTNSIRADFHTDLATTVLHEVQYRRANYYYFLGKTEPWGTSDLSPTVVTPDSDLENNLIRSNALYVKKITANDVSLVVDKHSWESGTVFEKWDHTKSIVGTKFYCVTEDNNVYKCLDNFGRAASTVKPTGKSFYPIRLEDGYLWKFMYNIPSFKQTRFSSLNYIPIQNALSDSFYNKGSIDAVVIENSGLGYSDAALTTIAVTGSTTGSGGSGSITVNPNGTITGTLIISGGTNYTHGVTISVNSITGSGAVLTPVIVGGVVTGITIVSGGIGYSETDLLTFSVGGAYVVPVISRSTGSFIRVNVVSGGAGYSGSVTLTITAPAGTGAYGNPTAILKGIMYNGTLQAVTVEDPGINYPTDLSTSILVQGDGTGGAFSPVIDSGKIVDIVVENPGSGYTSLLLTVVGTGAGAVLTGIVLGSDFQSDQSIVEQTAVNGKIYAIEVSNGGALYSSATTVTVTGDGTGCTAEPIIENGSIFAIRVTDFGSNYTYGTVTITDPNRVYFGTELNAVAYPIFPPIGGHGKDAVSELKGNTLAINMSLRNDLLVNVLNQDYRQYGLMKNPSEILSGKFFTGLNSLIAYNIQFDTVTGLVLDEILLFGSTKLRVTDIEGDKVTCQQLGYSTVPPVGTLVAEAEPSRTYQSIQINTYPVLNKYSGKLLYSSNENPFSFTEEQGIIIKTFLKF